MAEVVGTAFVRIRALTADLAKDISRGIDKGLKDADVDAAGATVGKNFAAKAGKEIKDGLTDSVGDSVKEISDSVDVDRGGRRFGDRFVEGFKGATDKLGTELTKLLDRVSFGKSGKRGGISFAKAFEGVFKDISLKGVAVGLGLLFSPLILDTAQALLGYVVGLVAQLGFVTTAAIGAGVALGTAFGTASIAILPLLLAFKTETPALERFKKVAEDFGKAWEVVGRSTQRTLLPGLTRALRSLRDLIPLFIGYGAAVGEIVGRFAHYIAALLRSERGQERIKAILESSKRILEVFGRIAVRVGDILSGIWVAALPAAESMAAVIETIIIRWQELVNQGEASGALRDTLLEWTTRAFVLFGALGDLFTAIFNILEIGGTSSVPLFDRFAEFAQRYREFTESEKGQNRLRTIFDNALEVMHEVNGIIAEIFDGMFNRLGQPGGTDSLVGGLRFIKESIPGIKETLGDFIEGLRPAMEELLTSLGELFQAFRDIGALEKFITLLTKLVEAFTFLIQLPGMDKFLAVMLSLVAAFALLKALGIVALFQALGTVLLLVAKILLLPGVAAGLAAFGAAVAGVAALAGAFALAYDAVQNLSGPLAAVAAAIGIVIAAFIGAPIALFAALGAAIGAVVRNLDNLGEAFGAVVRFFKDPMKRLTQFKENIEDLVGTIGEFLGGVLEAVGEVLGDVGNEILDFLRDLVDDVLDFLGRLPGVIGRAIVRLGPALLRALGEALLFAVEGAFALLFGAIELNIRAFILIFIQLPALIVTALAALGQLLVEAFAAAFGFLVDTLPDLASDVQDFFFDLPGMILDALDSLGDTLRNAMIAAFEFLVREGPGFISGLIDFFRGLPSEIATAVGDFGQFLLDLIGSGVDMLKEHVGSVIEDIILFFQKLPGRLTGLIGRIFDVFADIGNAILDGIADGIGAATDFVADFARGIGNAIIDFINRNVIDRINDAIPDEIETPGFLPDINLPDNPLDHLRRFAQGGLITRETLAILGEGNKPELVIPLTDPARALDLLQSSGLIDILKKSALGAQRSGFMMPTRSEALVPALAGASSGTTLMPGAVVIDARGMGPQELYDVMKARIEWEGLTTRNDS